VASVAEKYGLRLTVEFPQEGEKFNAFRDRWQREVMLTLLR
jgi:hypothetical protein